MSTDPAIPPAYAQNAFEWEMATDARPIYWIGPCGMRDYTDDNPRYVVWEAWSDGQCQLAWGLPLANAMKVVDALRWYRPPRRPSASQGGTR